MLRENKGITMISLVVTIIVLLILATVGVNTGMASVKSSRYYEAVHEMKVMQSEVNKWNENMKNGDETEWNKGELITSTAREQDCLKAYNIANSKNISDSNVGSFDGYRYFSKDCIKENLDIEGISYDFIVNVESRYVILVDGVEFDGVTYYSLGEIEDEQYNIN